MPNFTCQGFVLVLVPPTDRLPTKFRVLFDPVPDFYDPVRHPGSRGLHAIYGEQVLFLGFHPSVDPSVTDPLGVAIYDVSPSGEKSTIARGTLFREWSRIKFEDIDIPN